MSQAYAADEQEGKRCIEERVDILLELIGIGVCLPESLVTYICLLPVALLEPEDLKKIINNLVGGHRW